MGVAALSHTPFALTGAPAITAPASSPVAGAAFKRRLGSGQTMDWVDRFFAVATIVGAIVLFGAVSWIAFL